MPFFFRTAASRTRNYPWPAGLRYDVTNNTDLKLQVERISAEPGWDGDTTVVSIALDFIF